MKEFEELQFGRFRVTQMLGQGSMGIVYKAVDEDGKAFAIKTLKGMEPRYKSRFFREIEICRNLLHPNIAIPIEYSMEPTPFIAFEFIDGRLLTEALAGRGWLNLTSTVAICDQLGDGLQYVHELGIIHGDLSPNNVMITTDQNRRVLVKIVDFGISKIECDMVKLGSRFRVRESHKGLHLEGLFGTPGYICPELFAAPNLTPKADLFAMAVMTHEMLTGDSPYPGRAPSRTLGQPKITPLTSDFQTLFQKALAPNPDDRFGTAAEFASVFRNLVEGDAFKKALREHIRIKLEDQEFRFMSIIDSELYYDTEDLEDWEQESDPFFTSTRSLPGVMVPKQVLDDLQSSED